MKRRDLLKSVGLGAVALATLDHKSFAAVVVDNRPLTPELIKQICDEMLPLENKIIVGDYKYHSYSKPRDYDDMRRCEELVRELTKVNVVTVSQLRHLIKKHYHGMMAREQGTLLLTLRSRYKYPRYQRGVFYQHCGLVRVCIILEEKPEWMP
jgi:hypothetical protein